MPNVSKNNLKKLKWRILGHLTRKSVKSGLYGGKNISRIRTYINMLISVTLFPTYVGCNVHRNLPRP